ncbi:histidine phosphatase superfamily [Lipomyces orientalis]|uniref:Histidine phosphatase superfamily n=1 Tax=Lipomyces orientalis TaxID=1233043 RepID=A0ACC3TI15_9ASCO
MLDGYNILKYTGGQVSILYPGQVESLDKLYRYEKTHGKLAGPLEFFSTWKNYQAYEGFAGQETFSGPYAGLVTAFTRGSEYRERYGHLWDGDERVIVTARQFGQGFFGHNYSTNAAINIVPEVGQCPNSLMPICFAPVNTPVNIFDLEGSLPRLFKLFGNAAERMNSANPSRSLFRNVFTYDEWVVFNYILGMSYYYLAGPGSNSSLPVGHVLANATLALLEKGPTHHRNVDFGNSSAAWQISPQNGHTVFERLTCKRTAVYPAGIYVRKKYIDYTSVCQVPKEYPQYLDFFWNYDTTTELNYGKGFIPYAAELTDYLGNSASL